MQTNMPRDGFSAMDRQPEEGAIRLADLVRPLIQGWRWLAACTVLAAGAGFLVASMLPKWYSARTVMMPPQQQQSSATVAVAQLGALAGLSGGVGGLKSPADQYIALMQSVTTSDRLIDQFKLMEVYEAEFRVDARKRLSNSVRISAGKKDGLITVEVDDRDPQRAADMANAYVESLRFLTTRLAVTEAQQRRAFFEQQMKEAKERLTRAQLALGSAGLGNDLLKAEPKSAAESYARLRAEAAAAEVRLQTLRRTLTDNAPEVKQQESLLAALKQQVKRTEAQEKSGSGSEYITKYRNFKYEEALFDIFAKQYELARVDESREGALIQVVDAATAPERKAGPKRLLNAVFIGMLAFAAVAAWLIGRSLWRRERHTETT
jgi:uncharacterized protein involved in exopolysaccharide biosynthesis